MAELVETLDPCVASGAVGDQQPARIASTSPSAVFALPGRDHSVSPVQLRWRQWCRTCRGAGGPVGSGDQPRPPPRRQPAGTGPSRPRSAVALDPDPLQRTEATQPVVQCPEAVGCRRERLDAHTAVGVERATWTSKWVSTPPVIGARLYDGHGHPFSVQVVKGWHARPGRRP